MMRIYFITILFFFGLATQGISQDRATYSQYHLYPILINPGITGFHGGHQILFNYRNSWASFPGSPKAFTVSYDGIVTDRIGIGGQIFTEKVGSLDRLRAQMSYAYNFDADLFKIGMGLTTEYLQSKLDNSAIIDPFYDPGDVFAEEAVSGISFFDVTFGFYAEYDERFFFGLSVPNLVRARIDESLAEVPENTFFKYFTLMAGYRIDVSSYNFVVEPSILIKRLRNVPFQADVNLKLSFLEDQLIGGLVYTAGSVSKFGFLIGTRVNNVYISYNYDIGLDQFQDYSNGAHEVGLGIKFGQPTGTRIE
jgi:type IX secretion system PorP/SprF family membrane protein